MRLVYVICPVTADPIYRKKRAILESLARELVVELRFPLDSPTLPDLGDTLEALQECDAVIADLSLERPSCYFELGAARALRKPVYAVCHTASSVHQGIGSTNLETFSSMDEFGAVARQALKQAAKKLKSYETR